MAGKAKLVVELIGDSKSVERAFGRAAKSTGAFGTGLTRVGKAAIIAGAALGGAFAIGAKKSLDAASDLTEQINKANVVFGKSSGEVQQWSKGLASSFGLSQRAALEAAGTFGNMLVPMGYARDEAAKMSQQMVELAGDMASFNNASPEDTLLAIRSGLAGEAEPLRKFGVFLSEARVQAEALANTGKKNVKALTDQEKSTARYNLILKDTADTQGDFARSAGESVANQMRIMRAQLENVAAAMGQVLLPIALKFLGFVNKRLIPGISNAANIVKDWWKAISTRLSGATDFKAKLKVTFEGVAALAARFVDALIDKVESLLPQKTVRFSPNIAHSLGGVPGGADWNAIAEDVLAALAEALEASTTLAKSLATTINNAIGQVDWIGAGRRAGPFLLAMMGSAMMSLTDPGFWVRNWDLALAVALAAFSGPLGKLVSGLAAKILPGLTGMLARISPAFAAAFGRLIDDAGRVGAAVWAKVGGQLERLVAATMAKLGRVGVFVIKVLGLDVAINAVVQFARKVKEQLDKVDRWFAALPGKIDGYFADAGTWLYEAGKSIITGLLDGIKAGWEPVKKFLGWIKKQIPLSKGPPAEDAVLLREVGRLIIKGLGDGLEAEWPAIERKLDAMGKAMKERVSAWAQGVRDAAGGFASAFSDLASQALSAFDAAASQWVAPAQAKLDKRQLARQKTELKQAILDADKEIAAAKLEQQKALAAGDWEAYNQATAQVLAAQKQRQDAVIAQQDFFLQQQAARQEAAHEKQVARDRIRFESELARLQKQYGNQELTTKQFHQRLNKLMEKYGIDQEFYGSAAGISFANGITKATNAVVAAMKKLLRLLRKYLPGSNAELGPMSDLDRWMAGFSATLVKGIDYGVIAAAGGNIARTLGVGVQQGVARFDWAGLLNLPTGLGQALLDSIAGVTPADADPTVTALETVGDSFTGAGQTVSDFQGKIEALPDAAQAALNRLVNFVKQTLLPLPEVLAPAALAFLAIADAILAIGGAAYQARAALRDTAADIAELLRTIAAAGAAYGKGIPGMASGGPVRRGEPYVVGERGPELFIPSTSGRIMPASSATGGSALSQPVVNVAVYGDVTGEELVRKVREGLLRVNLYNPGNPVARPA